MSKENYKEDSAAINILLHPGIERLVKNSPCGNKYLVTLFRGTLMKTFGSILGPHSKVLSDRTPPLYVWAVPFRGREFLISSNETGTKYEVNYKGSTSAFMHDARVGADCVKFLEDIMKKVSNALR